MKIFYLTILVLNIIFAEQKIIFQSANPFTFKDIIEANKKLEVQEVHGILKFQQMVETRRRQIREI